MRVAQPGVRRGQDHRHDGPAAARDRCRRSAPVGDVPAIGPPPASITPCGSTDTSVAAADRNRDSARCTDRTRAGVSGTTTAAANDVLQRAWARLQQVAPPRTRSAGPPARTALRCPAETPTLENA